MADEMGTDTKTEDETQTKSSKKKVSFVGSEQIQETQPPINYLESLANLFKGNVGTGCFAMSEAIKNGGIVLGPIVLIIISMICVQCMHMLIRGSEYIMKARELNYRPDYADAVELSFIINKNEKIKRCAITARIMCNVAICITQLGFCCVYLIFVARSISIVLKHYEVDIEFPIILTIVLVPVWMTIMVRSLKSIAIFSGIATICMIVGAILTISYTLQDLPPITERNYAVIETLPLFFGTTLFAFEAIALVLPLQNAMEKPSQFKSLFGVLNVGMVLVTTLYAIIGFLGYWKYGEKTAGSLTLNLPTDQILAQVVILMVALGVMLGYPIQFFVAIQITFPTVLSSSKFTIDHPVLSELLFRTLVSLVTFAVAQLIPNLGLLLSLIGAVFCSTLVFIFPSIIEMTTRKAQYESIGLYYWIKNGIIILIAVCGIILGGGVSLKEIIESFTATTS